jgi:sulfide:quinone oxidoreductase
MAKILILGGGFGGVVAAESLARQLGNEHQITMVSRSRRFLFYPALVRLAFGKCEPDDVSFDLRKSMLSRRVGFIEAEAARVVPEEKRVVLARGEVQGDVPYDFLIFALGRRLATERVSGFFEYAHHLLDLDGAIRFGEAVRQFQSGRVVIGQCPEAKLPVPVYETAFALARLFEANDGRRHSSITIVGPESAGVEFQDAGIAKALLESLEKQGIDYLPDFPINSITTNKVATSNGHELDYDLLMLLPPFLGSSAVSRLEIANPDGYVNVDWSMKAIGAEGIYAVGDCVNLAGPKMGHMAVNQGEVAAANLAAETAGHPPPAHYQHDLMMVIDEPGGEGFYFHKDLWTDEPASLRHGHFWSWAKRIHEKYWEAIHS